jgi:membrane fusion protein (multidrug efflux system)
MAEEQVNQNTMVQSKRIKVFVFILIFLALLSGFAWWTFFRFFISTNDARISTNIVRIAPVAVGGQIKAVFVEEGSYIKKGQLLMEIDHALPEVQFNKAQAKYSLAEIEYKRVKQLYDKDTAPKKDVDTAKTNFKIAEAELKNTKILLDNTYIRSPLDGIVIQKIAQEGNLLEPGQVALVVSDIDHAWVQANIEETKVAKVHVGQPVFIKIDEGGSLKGTIQEITAATASQFSLMPAENAAGNYTKQVQKIPIKIALEAHPNRVLRSGQSVTIRINITR